MLALRTRPYHLFILLTLLQAFLFPQVSAQYEIPDPEACLEGGYYECSDSCPCGITNPDNALNIILCVISLLFSFTMVAGYVAVKELRDKPGDIIFALAIADILFAVGGIMSTLTHLQNDYFDPNDTAACNASSVINIVAIGMTYCYHIAFFIYYMTILRTSLKGGNVPGSVYHIFPLLGTTLFTLLLYQQGYVGRSIYGVCEMKTSPGIILPIISNVFILVIIYIFAHFTRKYTPQSERISSLRSQFVMFYLKYLVAISIIYIAKGVLSVLTGIMLNDILQDTIDSGLISELNAVKICFDILNGLTPVILTLGRLNDPLIQQHWKRLFRTITKKETSETGLTETLKRGSLNVKEFQVELEMQSHVQQFQHSRRVEVLYSLLSGIHYFWNVKQMNKLIELAPLKFSPDEKDLNEDYIKESKNFRTLFVQKETLTKQVPELFAEIKEKHYQPAKGTLTAFAPRLFEEIIELDSVGRGIRQSLDLKQNFSRILKSGVNGGGKSGEFFFFSADNKFIIKTVSNAEVEVLVDILPAYAKYLKLNPDSVIAKIYGVFKFEIAEPYERYNLILMRNINGYPSDCVDRKYDLKGSTVGRISIKEPNVEFSELKNRGVLKDLDFDKFEKKIHTSLPIKQNLYDAIKKDIGFLSSMRLVDYSLALYVVDRRKYMRSLLSISSESGSMASEESKQTIPETELRSTKSLVEETGVSESESLVAFKSTSEEKWYHLGIIDYLIPFGLKKRSEVFFKKLGALDPSLDISVQKPDYYGKRFVRYVEKILKD